MSLRRVLSITAALVAVAGGTVVAAGPASAATSGGGYVAVSPTRLLDTRTGNGAPKAAVRAHASVALQVTGRGGVPSSGVSAVVLNVTVTAPSSSGYITVFRYGHQRPTASNLNFTTGLTRPNLVVAPVGDGGKVALYNGSAGTVQLVADVAGYYVAGGPFAQGGFQPLPSPTRRLDTRTGTGGHKGAVGAHGTVSFAVTGSGVPSSASAVVVNLTVTEPTSAGPVTAYASGGTRPTASNVNFIRGQTVANLAVVPVGSAGTIALYNGSPGSVQLVADVAGYFTAGDPVRAGGFGALAPVRLLDTRSGVGAPKRAVAAKGTVVLTVGGRGGVPLSGVAAVILTVTPVSPTANGPVTVYADEGALPHVSNLNLVRGQISPNLVYAPVGSDGKVRLYNGSSGTVQLVADVSGYVLASALPVPTTVSTGRYVRNLTGNATTDTATMSAEGQQDAQGGSRLVLLHIGAQLNDKSGVQLSNTGTKLTYGQLVTALQAYLSGLGSASGVTVVIATNNDANDWTHYPAAQRGTDWADKVIDQLTAGSGVTVAGGDDIEAGFFSTVTQALQWEQAFLAATGRTLYFTGSADGCPSSYGGRGDCEYGWTQANYYALAHSGTRIKALPQIYNPAQAVQWANIDAVGGKGIAFAGALTESRADSATLPPTQGWAALYHALSTLVAAPSLAAITDLQIDS